MKKVLVVKYGMEIGGDTTALLALLNAINPEKYEIDLQLQRNTGSLLDQIPTHVHLLPQAMKYDGAAGKPLKAAIGVFSGHLPKAWWAHRKHGLPGLSGQIMADLQAKHFSHKNPEEYDVAIGFLEGWPARYVAHQVKAKKKLCWLHSTFSKLAAVPELEKWWMDQVNHIVFVTDNCKNAFVEDMPEYARKAVTIHNITDTVLIRKQAEQSDPADEDLARFRQADCFKVVTVCRVDMSVKGLDRMIKCVRQLKAMHKQLVWAVVGDGPDLEDLRQRVREADIDDYVLAVGKRLNPLPFVKEADVFCLLSRYEGRPMVITESMILGTPPLVTQYLAATEQIQDGVDGIIVENEDLSALPALLSCMENPKMLRTMKENLLRHDYGNSDYIHEITQTYFD